jgi:hypothetical protein
MIPTFHGWGGGYIFRRGRTGYSCRIEYDKRPYCSEGDVEDEAGVSYASLYTTRTAPTLAFPTILELLDIDHPVIGSCSFYIDSSSRR